MYKRQVIDESLRQFDLSRQGGLQQISDQAIASGAFGGGRQGALEGQFRADTALGRAGLEAQLRAQGFADAAARRGQAFGQQQALAAQRAKLPVNSPEAFLANEFVLNKDPFNKEKHALESAKMLPALIFQEALCSFGQDLKHEQQLSETLADMFTHLFTAESLIARVQQTESSEINSVMAMNIAKIDVAESFLDIILISGKCLNRIFEEKTPVHISGTVKKLKL